MLIQCHWQNRENPDQTEWIAQGEFADGELVGPWASNIFEQRRNECPEGWCPLVCTEGAACFVRTAEPVQSDGA